MKKIPVRLAIVGVLLTLSATFLNGSVARADEENLANYLQLLRADVSAAKVEAVNEALKLSASEAETFWPIYREYEFKLAKLSDVKVGIIKDFVTAQNSGGLDEAKASDIAGRWLKYQDDRLALWREYFGQLEAALNAVRAAQFLQVEHQMSLFIDLAVASEMPAAGASAPQPAAEPAETQNETP